MTQLKFVQPAALLQTSRQCLARSREIHLWAFELNADASLTTQCRRLLSPQDAARAERFAFPVDRDRYTLAHAVTRHVLSYYAGVPSASLDFSATGAGKPRLRGPASAVPLSFNLSHSHERAVLAVSCQREIGVDLEKIRPEVRGREIGERYFSHREWTSIDAATSKTITQTFFRHWVAKEAVLKAQGVGLGFELDRFSVEFSADGSRATVQSEDPKLLSPAWQVRMVEAGATWTAAVCAAGEAWEPVLIG